MISPMPGFLSSTAWKRNSAGWKRNSEKAGAYISLQIDDPTFAFPIRANLFKTDAEDGHWALYWNRPAKRPEKRDERG